MRQRPGTPTATGHAAAAAVARRPHARWLAAALSLVAAPAAAQGAVPATAAAPPRIAAPMPVAAPPPVAATMLARDAAAYAALAGVTVPEAERRLAAQEASVAATDALRERYRDRLAGIAIEQRPDFHLVVLLAGDAPVADGTIEAAGQTIPVVFRAGAAATLDQIGAALAERQAAIRAALAHPPGMGIDQRAGALVVVVAGADLDAEGPDALARRLALVAGVPVRVRSIDRPGVDDGRRAEGSPDGAGVGAAGGGAAGLAEGGARLVGGVSGDPRRFLCTAGFAVTDGARAGLATAAHCPDLVSYVDAERREHPLAFAGQWGWGYQDVQINLADGALPPLVHADAGASRPVLDQRDSTGMRAGDVVCHRGERSGYSCGTVELTGFAPAGDLCGGACLPTWVTVSGPGCGGGDSGAPVFVGATALGILKGGSYRADGRCGFYFYMPIEYLPRGWRLLTAATGGE